MSRALGDAELARRRPVWSALSTLWLDTELEAYDLRAIADVLAASGYAPDELEAICRDEVAPVVGWNLWTPVGVWDGFDEAWLHEQARRHAERSPRGLAAWLRRWFVRRALTPATEAQWQAVAGLLDAARAARTEAPT